MSPSVSRGLPILNLRAGVLQEMRGQQGYVIGTLAQRDSLDRKHIEPEIQVLAEALVAYGKTEIAVGGGDDPHIDVAGACLSDALELTLLQHAQQLALQFERDVADFVQKQRAAIGQFEPPGRSRSAPANAPLACPKNSLSNISRGTAAQLTRISGRWLRLLAPWMARAISSFPVPDSPVIRTLASVGATSSIWRSVFCIAALSPMMPR